MDDITVEELKTRMDSGEDLIIIDVREPHEFEEFNIGARLIPLGTLPNVIEELEDLKDEEIILHCRSGARSGQAKAYMQSIGFNKVRNMLGGVLDWQMKFSASS
jgi:rhodanese-related sulfurtransferase